MSGFRSVSILTVAFSGFSRKINFAHANYFWTNTPSFYGAEKNPLPFSPSMRFIIFHGHHYANLRGLVSFYFRSIKLVFFGRKPSGVQSLFLCTVFCGWYFFTGTFLKFQGVTCTFAFFIFFGKRLFFTWKNTA